MTTSPGSAAPERTRDPDDRRAWRLHVTAKAEPLVERLKALAGELFDQAFSGIAPEDIEKVREMLARVRENVGRAGSSDRAVNQ